MVPRSPYLSASSSAASSDGKDGEVLTPCRVQVHIRGSAASSVAPVEVSRLQAAVEPGERVMFQVRASMPSARTCASVSKVL